ncbi:hypothetical protein H4582DRAFT_2099825 [Lactarius indigo]|nr:hypothetical protein H4582DRAFT_2099825 [Lactarius indigo]
MDFAVEPNSEKEQDLSSAAQLLTLLAPHIYVVLAHVLQDDRLPRVVYGACGLDFRD